MTGAISLVSGDPSLEIDRFLANKTLVFKLLSLVRSLNNYTGNLQIQGNGPITVTTSPSPRAGAPGIIDAILSLGYTGVYNLVGAGCIGVSVSGGTATISLTCSFSNSSASVFSSSDGSLSVTANSTNTDLKLANPLFRNQVITGSLTTNGNSTVVYGDLAQTYLTNQFGDTTLLIHGDSYFTSTVDNQAGNRSWVVVNVPLGGVDNSGTGRSQQNAIFVSATVPMGGSVFPYQKNGVYARVLNYDNSSIPSDTKDAVGVAGYGVIASNNSIGRVWGMNSYGVCTAGGGGFITSNEADVANNCQDWGPGQNNAGNANGLLVVTTGTFPGTNGMFITGTGGSVWHKGVAMNANTFYSGTNSSFLELVSAKDAYGTTTTYRVDSQGWLCIGTRSTACSAPVQAITSAASLYGETNVMAAFRSSTSVSVPNVVIGRSSANVNYIGSGTSSDGSTTDSAFDIHVLGATAARIQATASAVNYPLMQAQAGAAVIYSAAGSASNISTTIGSKAAVVNIVPGNLNIALQVSYIASAVNYAVVTPGITGVGVTYGVAGSDSSIPTLLTSKNSPVYIAPNNVIGLSVNNIASAVNYALVSGAITGGTVLYGVTGTDANISVALSSKAAAVYLAPAGLIGFGVANTGFGNNYIQASGATSGASPFLSAVGSDTNLDFWIIPKGTGLLKIGTASTAATTPGSFSAARYLPIKDSTGTTYYVPLATSTWLDQPVTRQELEEHKSTCDYQKDELFLMIQQLRKEVMHVKELLQW